ncbi:glycosyl transferase family 2 [Bacteroidia bacterium]|nr:glycosyl transferase family 2 [Bacteroidia bacterium]
MPTQVIIADDGSGEDTRKVVEKYQQLLADKVDFRHVWQIDAGFRSAANHNNALAQAIGDYIVVTDGDVILHPKFIADHLRFAKSNTFVAGTRQMLSKSLTDRILRGEKVGLNMFTKGIAKPYRLFRGFWLTIINEWIMQHKAVPSYFLGCNVAFWKTDILNVNGYNEDFEGWGKEDNEIAVRLINAGKMLRMLYFGAFVFHLYHKENSRELLPKNEEILCKSINNKLTRIDNGIYKN